MVRSFEINLKLERGHLLNLTRKWNEKNNKKKQKAKERRSWSKTIVFSFMILPFLYYDYTTNTTRLLIFHYISFLLPLIRFNFFFFATRREDLVSTLFLHHLFNDLDDNNKNNNNDNDNDNLFKFFYDSSN